MTKHEEIDLPPLPPREGNPPEPRPDDGDRNAADDLPPFPVSPPPMPWPRVFPSL